MINKKRGQITLFIIIGILIIAVIGIVYYAIPPKEIQVKELDTTAIEEYVTACLDSKVKEGLSLIGKQGGYFDPGDYHPLFEGEKIYNVSYVITKPHLIRTIVWDNILGDHEIEAGTISNPFPAPPEYPWQEFPTGGADTLKPGLFGITHLPNLIYGDNSVESQLEKHISQNIAECLDLSVFEEQGFEITEEPYYVNITIARDNVIVNLFYPLEIKKAEQKVDLEKFSTNINVRFGRIYSFVRELILNEVSDITFIINDSAHEYDGLSITKITYDDIDFFDDLIIVSDSKSSLYGRPYEFRFMRGNRLPAANINLDGTVLIPKSQDYSDPDEDIVSFGVSAEMCIEGEACICDQGELCDSPS